MKNPKLILLSIFALCTIIIIALGLVIFKNKTSLSPESLTVVSEEQKMSTATLEIFSLPVWVIVPGTSDKVEGKPNQEVTKGTIVITGEGGRAQLIYSNHAVTRLDSNTEISLEELTSIPQQVKVKLEKNRIWSRIPKLLGKESYQTETNTVVATVRGTSYGHGILSDGRNKLTTIKGTVEAGCVDKNLANRIPKDHKIFFDCGNVNEIDEGIVDEKDKDDWFEFNQKEDKELDKRFGLDIYGDEEVLGATTDVLGESTDRPSITDSQPTVANVDCVGPDGKTAHAPQADCDNLKKFWDENGSKKSESPASTSTTDLSSTTSNTNPIASPDNSPLPTPLPSAIPSVIPNAGPTISNMNAQPPDISGSTNICSVTFSAEIRDPDGVNLYPAKIDLQVYDSSGIPQGTTSSFDMLLASDGFTISSSAVILAVPASGYVSWTVTAQDNLANSTSVVGGSVNEVSGIACLTLL